MIKALLLSLVAFLAISQGCVVKDENGEGYDLSGFTGQDTVLEDKGYATRFRFCEPVGEKECKDLNCSAGLYQPGDKTNPDTFITALAIWENKPEQPKVESMPNGVKLTFSNAAPYLGLDPVAVYRITCSDNKEYKFGIDFKDFIFNFDISHPAGCAGASSGGLSGGWVFIIILLVSIILWLVIGVLIMHKVYGAPLAVSSAPGYPFLITVPSLAIAGVKVTYSKIRGLAGKPAAEYE